MFRVLIVEDDTASRVFFESSVNSSPQLSCIASVSTVADARAVLSSEREPIDVLLTDIGLPDGSGIDLIRFALATHPSCEALVISMFGDEDTVLKSIEAGALGYIHKDAAPENIAKTILEMKAGASPISPLVARQVLAKYAALTNSVNTLQNEPAISASVPLTHSNDAPVLLSLREQEVLQLIARGFSYAEIAGLCSLSIHTVQSHVKNLYFKLGVHSRSEAVFEATQIGLLR